MTTRSTSKESCIYSYRLISKFVKVDPVWPSEDYETHEYSKNIVHRQPDNLSKHPCLNVTESHADRSYYFISRSKEILCSVSSHVLNLCSSPEMKSYLIANHQYREGLFLYRRLYSCQYLIKSNIIFIKHHQSYNSGQSISIPPSAENSIIVCKDWHYQKIYTSDISI